MSPPRLRPLLVVLGLAAGGLLVFGEARLEAEGRLAALTEARRAAEARLAARAEVVGALFRERVPSLRALADELAAPEATPEALRERLRRGVYAQRALLADARGRTLFPPAAGRSAEEVAFLLRLGPAAGTALEGPATPDGVRAPGPDEAGPAGRWRTWYAGPGLQVGFLRTTGAGPEARRVLIELERARLVADVIERLPEAEPAPTAAPTALLDEAGRVIYAFGGAGADGAVLPSPEEAVSVGLLEPLEAWRLVTRATPGAADAPWGLRAAAILGLLLLALALRRIERESARAAREAEQRVTFVNHVSHELKTPLTNIRLYAELLQEALESEPRGPGEPDEPALRHLGVIVAESQRLSRLIGNILTFARSQRSTLAIRRAPAVLDELVQEVLLGFRPALAAKGVVVETRLAASAPRGLDADAVRQIVGNLVSNVEKYAASGGMLLVTTALPDAGTLRLTVRDRGPGIPPAAAERVFEPFFRLSDRLSEGAAGTGIGLPIARELARLHGGDVRLVRTGPDEPPGACFEVTLQGAAP